PMEKGSGWMRVVASPQEAEAFHSNFSSQSEGSYEISFTGNQYIFPKHVLEKMAAWSNKSPDFERQGYFIARKINNKFEIIDFIPLGSISADPVIFHVKDELTTQVSNSIFSVFGIDENMTRDLGVDLKAQDRLSFGNISKDYPDAVSIPFHSHHQAAAYRNGPSEQDKEIAQVPHFVFSMGNQRGYFYDKDNVVEVGSATADSSLRSESMPRVPRTPGGIDFRFLPIVTQSMGNLKAGIGAIPLGSLRGINLTQEWSDIEHLVNAGITPSAERLKEYLAASCFKGSLDTDMNRIVSCIADILRMQEGTCCLTDPTLKDILVVLGSGRSAEELKLAFSEVH
ncbi:MAG: hypothetical protein AAB089_06665, partial [Nitrospirota bacterium]